MYSITTNNKDCNKCKNGMIRNETTGLCWEDCYTKGLFTHGGI